MMFADSRTSPKQNQRQRRTQQQSTTTTSTTTTRRMFSIPLEASTERRQGALLGQLEHHRNRRLARNEHRRRLQQQQGLRGKEEELLEHHPGSWRQSYGSAISADDNNKNSHRDLKGVITSVPLSNCHLVLYSGRITLGSPPNLQHFKVDFDTAGSDLWVPSKLCDGTCTSDHPSWNLYDPDQSSTYAVATSDPSKNNFALEYQDGEAIRGQHAKDTLRLGDDDIRISHQVFAHVTHIQNFATCEQEEGILGLANAMQTTHGFPSLLGNILRHSQANDGASKVMPYNMFGMYLRSDVDDYEGIDVNNPLEKPRESSELILGGINSEHYLGCLQWHDLVQATSAVSSDGISDFEKYWSVRMDDVKVGGTTLKKAAASNGDLIAVLDSGSSYIVGPQAPVAHMVQLNNAKCFRMDATDGGEATDPREVDCNDPGGFDGAVLNNCDDPFFSVEFVIDGQVYNLEKEDLMVHLDTLFGKVCIMRVVASQGMNGWILGDAFLNKYYTAFDFENQKLGLALAAEFADDRCERDIAMDVNNFWKNGEDDVDPDVFDPEDYQPPMPGNSGGVGGSSGNNSNNGGSSGSGSTYPEYDDDFGFPSTPEIGNTPATADNNGDPLLDDDFFTNTFDDDQTTGAQPNLRDDDNSQLVNGDDNYFPTTDLIQDDDAINRPDPITVAPQAPPSEAPTAPPTPKEEGSGSPGSSTDKNTYNDDIASPITDFSDDVADTITDFTDDVADPVTQYTDDNSQKQITDFNDDGPASEITDVQDDDMESYISGSTGSGGSSSGSASSASQNAGDSSDVQHDWKDDDAGGYYDPNGGDADASTTNDQTVTVYYDDDNQVGSSTPDDTTTTNSNSYNDDVPISEDSASNGGIGALYDDEVDGGFAIAQFDDGPVPDSPPVFSPTHHENPERASVWKGINKGRAPGAKGQDIGFIGIAGIVLLLAMFVPVVAFLLHKKRRQMKGGSSSSKDEAFDRTYKKAEQKMLREHRNLNYRNHQGRSPRNVDAIDIALDEMSYVDEEFRDEEGGNHHHTNGENGVHGVGGDDEENDFVLDSNMLQRMN